MGYPYPIKDWTEASHYKNLKNESPHQLAWEFLRRNALYQEHWDLFEGLPDTSLIGGKSSNKNGKWRGMPHQNQNLDTYYGFMEPRPRKGQHLDEYEAEYSETGYEIRPYDEWFCATFKILPHPESPKIDIPNLLEFDDSFSDEPAPPWEIVLYEDLESAKRIFTQIRYPIAFVFDLTLSLDRQLKQAKRDMQGHIELLEHGKDLSGFKTQKSEHVQLKTLPSYLRVLDAVASGATFIEIDQALFKGQRSVDYTSQFIPTKAQEHYEAAKKISASKYMFIR